MGEREISHCRDLHPTSHVQLVRLHDKVLLIEQPETELRLLVRPGSLSDARKAGRISSLIERSAIVAHGDLTNRESLEHATKDVDVVISAVQGDREIIIDGQLALLDVATRNGVRRMMPADFAGDLFEAPEGGHPLLGMRHTSAYGAE